MTLSISDQTPPWHRLSSYPKRLSLLTDATIDPFPSSCPRSASLLEHHIVRDRNVDRLQPVQENVRRSTAPFIPRRISQLNTVLSHPNGSRDIQKRKRSVDMMDDPDTESPSSPTSIGHGDGTSQFCLCQPEPKIPRPRNGE